MPDDQFRLYRCTDDGDLMPITNPVDVLPPGVYVVGRKIRLTEATRPEEVARRLGRTEAEAA